MTDEEYAPADTSSSLSDAPSSSPAPIPSASPKPSPAPSNSPAPGSKLNHFLNNSIVYPSIIGSCRGENGKGSFLDVGESASGRFKRLSSTLVYQPAVVHPREDWGKLESIDPLVYNIAHPAQQHKEIARKVPRSDGFAAFDANSKSTVSWQGHCALLMQLLQEIDGNHFTSGEALTRLLVMSSYGMTDIYVAHQYPIEIWNDESFANDPSLGTPDDSTARRYEPKLPDGMARVNVNHRGYDNPKDWRERVSGKRFVSTLVFFREASHWVAVLWDRVKGQLYVFDTWEDGRISRIKATVLAWREWLGICGLPYTFDYFAPPLTYQPDNNSCGPLAIRSLSLAVRGHVGVTYRALEGNKPSLALNIDGRRDTAQAEAELRYYDWVPIPWEIESKEDMQKQRDMAYSLTKLAMLEELGSIDGSFQRQKTNKEGKPIGLMRKVYAGTEGELTLIRGITQNITEDDMFSRFGGYNHIFITRLGRETGFRGRHELEKAGSSTIQGVATWRKESLCEESPRTTLARMKDPQAKRLSALGMAVRGPVPDDGKATSRAGSPMVIDSTDQSGPPSRHVSPVVQPKHSTPPPPATPKTPKTPKNPPANPQSVGATPLAKLKITSSFPSPKPKDQSNSRAGNAPVIVRTDIPPDIEGALYVRKNRVPAPDKRAAKKTAQDLGTCAKEMTVEPAQWGLPVAGEPEFAHLPTSKTWASFVPAGLMSPRQWDNARNAVVDAFRPQPVAGRSREERMEKRNRKWEDQ